MPTIHRQDGFRFMIYSLDHAPAHVHCIRAGVQIVVEIETLAIRRAHSNARPQDIREAVQIVAEQSQFFLQQWSEQHG